MKKKRLKEPKLYDAVEWQLNLEKVSLSFTLNKSESHRWRMFGVNFSMNPEIGNITMIRFYPCLNSILVSDFADPSKLIPRSFTTSSIFLSVILKSSFCFSNCCTFICSWSQLSRSSFPRWDLLLRQIASKVN